jgi:DNA repair exonuclease SbcCD ATPase subunit
VIHFKKIRWKNFLSTGNAFTEVQLDRTKSTLIIGDNGAGKSTILDALTFVLFGKPFRAVNKSQLVNSVNQNGTEVEVEFSIGSKQYLVKRGIKKNFFEIYQDGKMLNQDASVRDYQEYLEKTILKLNYKSFTQIVILGSSSFVPFMQLKASDRRTIIEDLLDIEIFSVMNQLLKVRVAQNKEDMGTVDIALGLSKGEKENVEYLIEKLKQNKTSQIEANKRDIQKHEKAITDYRESIDKILDKNKELNDSIADEKGVRKEVAKLHDYQKGIEKGILKCEEDIEFYEKTETCDTCKQQISEDHRENMIEEFHGKMHELSGGLMQLGKKLKVQEDRIAEIEKVSEEYDRNLKEQMNMNSHISACEQYIKKVSTQIKDISNMEDDIEKQKSELEEVKKDILIYTEEKEELSQKKYLYEIAGSLLKDGGIKAKIIKQYLPIINKYINVHLGKMDFYVSFELDEGFNETIKSRHRDEFTYDSFSEGEKMRIDLALLFTWRAIAKLKNSVNTNLLILDEVFDSSLDTAGTDEFLKILYDLTGNVNTFVISHKGEVLYDKFDKTIKFEKHQNFSRIAS